MQPLPAILNYPFKNRIGCRHKNAPLLRSEAFKVENRLVFYGWLPRGRGSAIFSMPSCLVKLCQFELTG